MGLPTLGLLLVGAFATAASIARLKRVANAFSLDAGSLADFARRGPGRSRALALAFGSEPATSSLRQLAEGLAEENPALRVAACNEAIHDVESDLDWGTAVPSAALRLCVFATLLAAAAVILLRRPGLPGDLMDVAGLGVGACVLVLAARREADGLAKRGRLAVDGWVSASTGRGTRTEREPVENAWS